MNILIGILFTVVVIAFSCCAAIEAHATKKDED